MTQRAGIALGRLTYDSDFSITRVDHEPNLTFSPPVRHKLVDGHTVKDIINTFHDVVGFDAKSEYNGFMVSIPISASSEQYDAFINANNCLSDDHFHVWVNGHIQDAQQCDEELNIDLSSIGDVYDKLVVPIVPAGVKLHQIGILRPEGAFPDICATDLESKFPDTPVKWLTLDDLSYGTAVVMSDKPTTQTRQVSTLGTPAEAYLPIGVALSTGKSVTILPKGRNFSVGRIFFFTTSKDNQQTATVRLLRGNVPIGEVTLEGMIPRPKGEPAIKVTSSYKPPGGITVTVGEIGTDLKVKKDVENVINCDDYFNGKVTEACEAYEKCLDKQIDMTFGENGIIGELPE
ncbi:hypothetical protein CPB86DRAFT_316951 [Serendipita vermifera]|nr:hypothetical protein CPB86DRAFT_316951 [Serendipita vermifera]